MSVDDKSIKLFRQIFMIRDNKVKTSFATLGYRIHSLACLMHLIMDVYMIEAATNGFVCYIIFISTVSLEYSSVVVEDSAILNFAKRNTSLSSFFKNRSLIKVVVDAYKLLRFEYNSLKTGDPNGMSFTLSKKNGSSLETSGARIALIISCLVNGNTLCITILCTCWLLIVGSRCV